MKKLVLVGFFLTATLSYAQPDTEVYLLDITEKDKKIELSNLRNVSNNEGYDNQPSFCDENMILFSSTRNGQTDIASYTISNGEISWLTDTPGGSEYSPLRIPGSEDISAIRLDTNGLQRLYRYDIKTGKSEPIRKDAKVGYHVWYSKDILINTVLIENRMDLVVSNLNDGSNHTVQKNVGRSLQKIPKSDLVGYISKVTDSTAIKSLHPITGAIKWVSPLPEAINDICWMPDGSLLIPSGKSIYIISPGMNGNPKVLHRFEEKEINSISRMAVSPDGKYLALVSETSPAKIVQKQVESYNAANLDAFVNCYSEEVVVRNFPNDTLYIGREKMRENYSGLSPEKKVYDVEVVKRIIIGNKVIDEEKVTGNGKVQRQVAMYEVMNGRISSMTFIFDDGPESNPETIVQKQLEAYNARDIDGFLATYSEDVKVFDFPNELQYEGTKKMREGYSGFFKETPNLNCEIKNRMVIGNKVIDEEFITMNGNNFSTVAIYEVENGKIAKVTFLR